jgi:hypothetical protein
MNEFPKPASQTSFWSFEPSHPVSRYVFRMWLITFPIAAAVGWLFSELIPSRHHQPVGGIGAFSALVVAPLLETLLLALTLKVISIFTGTPRYIAIVSGLAWGLLHALGWPPAIVVGWPFYVMSRAYIAWRPLGFGHAFKVVALIHAAYNFIPALFMLFV